MNKAFVALLLLSMLSTASVSVLAADPEGVTPENAGTAGEGEPTGGSIPNLKVNQAELEENEGQPFPVHPDLVRTDLVRNPLMDRIETVVAAADLRLVELQSRLDAGPSRHEALELVKSIEQVKIQTELDILALQVSHARQTGRDDIAQEIETAIETMTSPRPVGQPKDRPAPTGANH